MSPQSNFAYEPGKIRRNMFAGEREVQRDI